MTVRVGFIGSAHSVSRVAEAAAQLPGVDLRCYPYTDPHHTTEQYASALAENDAVCFSGTISHYHRDRELDGETPVFVARFSNYTLVASLLAALAGRHSRTPELTIPEISIDLPNPEVAAAVTRDTAIVFAPEQVYDYRWVYEPRFSRPVDVAEIVRFHLERAATGGARLALTSVHAVYDKLVAAGHPAMFMVDALPNELEVLRTAQQRISVQRLEGALLAVVTVTTVGAVAADSPAAATRAALVAELGRFASPVQHRLAAWRRDGLDMFYTTRGELDARLPRLTSVLRTGNSGGERATDGGGADRGAPDGGGAARSADERPVVAMGVGVGRHLYEAEDRAVLGLQRAIADQGLDAYLVDEEARVHGLLREAEPAEALRHTDPWLVSLAATAGMRVRSLTRLLDFLETRDFHPFTAAEWSGASHTSARTAERTVRKLLDAGALQPVGQEQPLDAGRPRTIYALTDAVESAARQRRAAALPAASPTA